MTKRKKRAATSKTQTRRPFTRGDKVVFNGKTSRGIDSYNGWYVVDQEYKGVVCAFFVGDRDPRPPTLLDADKCVLVEDFE